MAEVLQMIAVVCDETGPTCRVAEVLEVDVCDSGGNVYGSATTKLGAIRIQRKLRIKTHLNATRVGRIGDASQYDFHPCYSLDCGLWLVVG